ncbi:MAG: hypothetical protein EOO60_03230 [Hymenobacter sp.]|nr:MAG: hypothetical protein EOO60_03230 [Hymenobacter sp.]
MRVAGGMKWRQVTAGAYLTADGTLWAWGLNSQGQVGDGTTTYRVTPQQIGGGTAWTGVVAGAYHNAALRPDGTCWVWGTNRNGQLGIGVGKISLVPQPLGSARCCWASPHCGCASGQYALGLGRKYRRPTRGWHICGARNPCADRAAP